MKKGIVFLLLLCLAAGLCACGGKSGLKASDIDAAKLKEIVDWESVSAKHKSISWERIYDMEDGDYTVRLQAVKEGQVWLASYEGEMTGSKTYSTFDYSEENGGFSYSLTQGSYDYQSMAVVADGCEQDQAAILWTLAMNSEGQITEVTEQDGSALVKLTMPAPNPDYTLDVTYTIDLASGLLIASEETALDADGNVAGHTTCGNFVYDGDTKLDTTAKDALTTGDDLCKLSIVMVAEDGSTKTRTVSVVKGSYTGMIMPSGYELVYYADQACTQETDIALEADEETYYAKLLPVAEE